MKTINSDILIKLPENLIKEILELAPDPNKNELFKLALQKSIQNDRDYQNSKASPKSAKEQYEILKKIEKKCELLLAVLRPLRTSNMIRIEDRDLETGSIIRNNFSLAENRRRLAAEQNNSAVNKNDKEEALNIAILNFSKSVNERKNKKDFAPENASLSKDILTESLPFDYPVGLIEQIDRLRSTVAFSATKEKPGRGNSSSRNSYIIRKKRLTRDFIRAYHLVFQSFPSKTKTVSENKVNAFGIYQTFLEAAGLRNESDGLNNKNDGTFYVDSIKSEEELWSSISVNYLGKRKSKNMKLYETLLLSGIIY